MRVIYLDVLLIVNLFVNYFLLLSTAQFVHRRPRRLRLLLGALIGSAASVLILLPNLGLVPMLAIKLVLASLIVLTSFGYGAKAVYIKTVLIFFGVNFIFAGVMLALWLVIKPPGMYYSNGMVYFNISAVALAVGTILSYLVIRLVCFVFDRRVHADKVYQMVAEADGKQVALTALHDTGNHLVEMFSGTPVVVCELSSVEPLIPTELHSFFEYPSSEGLEKLERHPWRPRVRLVPYRAVGAGGVIAAFKPDKFTLTLPGGREEQREVYIGVTSTKLSQGEFQSILHADLLG